MSGAKHTPIPSWLCRVRGGYYVTVDGQDEIIRGDTGCSWNGMWIERSTTNRRRYSDPIRTLREAIMALACYRAMERGESQPDEATVFAKAGAR